MKVLGKACIWTVPIAVIVLVLLIAGCKNPDRGGPFGFTIQSNSKLKVVFSDPIFRQIGFDSNDPYSEYLTEGVGLEYHDQKDLINIIDSAKHTVDIASTEINNREMADRIVGMANRGISVRIVTEKSNFDFIDPSVPESTKQIHQQMLDAGVQIHPDNDDINRLMHERYMIIDNEKILVGSSDFLSTSFSEAINNTMIIDSTMTIDPAVATASQVNTVMDAFVFDFEQMFTRGKFGTAKDPLFKNSFEDTGTTIDVYFGPTNNITEAIRQQLINADVDMVYCIQQFTSNTMYSFMTQMAQRANFAMAGIIDRSGWAVANDNLLTQLKAQIYNGMGYDTINHKFIIIDFPLQQEDYEYTNLNEFKDPVVLTGSPNWTEANFAQNDEDLLIIHDLAIAYMYGKVEFEGSNLLATTQQARIFGETRSAVNNVPLQCTIEVRVERKGFLPGLPVGQPATADSDPETAKYEVLVPGGLTDVTVTNVPGGYMLPDYIAGNQLIFPGGSQKINWFIALQPSGSGSGSGGGGGGGGGQP